MQTDIRAVRFEAAFPDVKLRTPLKFGAAVLEGLPLCEIRAEVETRDGRRGVGHGAMLLSDFWAWPSAAVERDVRLAAMERFAQELCVLYEAIAEPMHPVDLFHEIAPEFPALAASVSAGLGAAEPMPALAQVLCASPVDIAVHDAFGVALGIPTYDAYGPEHMRWDLSRYLGSAFHGRHLADFIRTDMPDELAAFHLVGGLDKLREDELTDGDPRDGLPVSLDQWIRTDGVRCFKVKLRGTDLDWDVARMDETARVCYEELARLGVEHAHFSVDPNEMCESPDYMIEMMGRLAMVNPRAERDTLYVEQPTARDLDGAGGHDMHALAARKPVVIDESLTSTDQIDRALALGWSGLALKQCKGQSAALLAAAKAASLEAPCTIQDLTNPGASLLASVALAGHLNPWMGIEVNSRQYTPAANEAAAGVHPGVMRVRDGVVDTRSIRGPGLGYRWEEWHA